MTAEGSFTVEVVDTTAPIVTTPASLRIEAQGPEGAPVAFGHERATARTRRSPFAARLRAAGRPAR